ncbi:hypothetical protein Clacol_002009 [Clathrus columnatus]|uniref:Mitochondrial glycine transporter n=1 Tax=Clathrus columnatus TaxID=1419009 RepID=A0AAV5A3G8_9AGAM|nr:hypothetical protein Clacol_002009 [Clathrus columnatus]
MLKIVQTVVISDGVFGLWRGTLATLARNIPGVALYMSSLNQVRSLMASMPYFTVYRPTHSSTSSALPVLTVQGNLFAGAITRSSVGILLNPFTILKARYESDLYAYRSVWDATKSIILSGPSTFFRGAAASAARDAPYAGIFLVSYEQIKHDIGENAK